MRAPIICLAALALAACGSASASHQAESDPSLGARSPSRIIVYQGQVPRCAFREVGSVVGQTYREIQAAAYRLRANAVILEPRTQTQPSVLEGSAVQFTTPGCRN